MKSGDPVRVRPEEDHPLAGQVGELVSLIGPEAFVLVNQEMYRVPTVAIQKVPWPIRFMASLLGGNCEE